MGQWGECMGHHTGAVNKRKLHDMTEAEMWQATINNDERYNGRFFYAVTSTGVCCKPSCKSKIPRRENVVFFETMDAAMKNGFRPCKRCRPDLGPGYDPEKEVIGAACEILYDEYTNSDILKELPGRVGISPYHFQRVFKKHTGFTPRVYLQQIKLLKAIELMNHSDLNNTEICYACGFKSLSNFYLVFRQYKGCSPSEFKKKLTLDAFHNERDKKD